MLSHSVVVPIDGREDQAQTELVRLAAEGFFIMRSCQTTWLLDTINEQFCRVEHGLFPGEIAAQDWQACERIFISEDQDVVVIQLDRSGSRLIRARRHQSPCERCQGTGGPELSPSELRRLARPAFARPASRS